MKFQGVATRGRGLRATLLSCLVVALSLLASCGGGGEPVSRFIPTRLIVFGDDAAVLDDSTASANARKNTVNYVTPGTTDRVCGGNANWAQAMAALYGLVFSQCNPSAATPTAFVRAQTGWKVADASAAVDTFQAADSFRSTDMVVIMVGQNDVLAAYQQYPTLSEADATAQVEQRGAEVAQLVNRIAATGAKVIISSIIDIGYSPYAAIENASHTDTPRGALISRLVKRFNAKLRVGIENDGRKIGLVLSDETVLTIVQFPSQLGYANVTDAACDPVKTPSVIDCTTATLKEGASAATWLWADNLQLSPAGHSAIAQLFQSRAVNNPF